MSQHLEVTLASLNSHGGRGADGIPFDLAAACRSLAAALTLLQECWHGDREGDPLVPAAAELGTGILRADLPADVSLPRLSISGEIRRGGWGLAVLTTLPIISSEVLALGRAPGDKFPRAAQLVTVALPGGGRLRVVNAHLTHRFTSPVQLVRLVRHLLGSRVPTVIAGDLNMPGPVTGLAADYRQAVRGPTFPAGRPLVQLDHVLAGHGVAFGGGEVLPPVGSDHRPVRARLRLA